MPLSVCIHGVNFYIIAVLIVISKLVSWNNVCVLFLSNILGSKFYILSSSGVRQLCLEKMIPGPKSVKTLVNAVTSRLCQK